MLYVCQECGRLFKAKKMRLYCCDSCRQIGRMRHRKGLLGDATQGKPVRSIEDIMAIAERLSKEQGRVVSYGEVQVMEKDGKL